MIHTIYTIYTIIPSLDKHPTKEVVIAVKKRSNENGILEKVSQSCLFHMAQRREKQQNKLLLIEVENICSFRDIRVVSQTNLIRKRKRSPQALQHDPRQASKQQTHTKY